MKAIIAAAARARPAPSTAATTTYHTTKVDGLDIFYREAGPKDAPTILLLHGYPSSSRMFATLIPLLADRYHLVAPDYPGFGQCAAPPAGQFRYPFDHLAQMVDHFTQSVGLKTYVLYEQDYGGPIGMRLAVAHPQRVRAIIVQNAVAHEDGLGPAWAPLHAFWRDRVANEDKVIPAFVSLAGAKARHLGSSPHPERYDPETWQGEYTLLSRPGSIRSSRTCSSTTRPTSSPTPHGRRGCARTSRRRLSYGASMTPFSRWRRPRRTGATCRIPKSTSSTRAISRSTKRSTRSPG
ncbi:pimeloyl-ACP methyl ester carboxylesterase [Sphingomonas sp. UYP23]